MRWLLLSLLVATNAQALTTVTVNAGGGADYTSLNAAITALAATADDIVINCVGSTNDTTAVTIASMSATSLTIIGDGAYVHSTDSYSGNFFVNDKATIRGLIIEKRGSGGKSTEIVKISTAHNIIFERNTVRYAGTWTSDIGRGSIWIASHGSGGGGDIEVNSNYIVGAVNQGIRYSSENGEDVAIINNTVVGSAGIGIYTDTDNVGADVVDISNNIVQTSTGDDYSLSNSAATNTRDTNISEDTTSPNASFRSKTITFDTAPTLDAGETDAIDVGTDKSAAVTNSVDIFGTSRPQGSAWDIGAHELTADSGPSVIILRRRRE